MNSSKIIIAVLGAVALLPLACKTNVEPQAGYVVCAYAACQDSAEINTQYINRIIYSYAEVDTVTCADVVIENPERFAYVASLKKERPDLEVMLSLGGNSQSLSLALRNDSLRKLVVADCMDIVRNYGIDGIDVDWEWPGRGPKALSRDEDLANFVKLLTELRAELGPDRLLTIAVSGTGYSADFEAMTPLIDAYNVMTYDMGWPPDAHHSALHWSDRTNWLSTDSALTIYSNGGVPGDKIIIGMPFYGHGIAPYEDYEPYADFRIEPGCTERYDSISCVPWIADSAGRMVLTYDNPASIALKCDFIKDNKLAGAMYWRIENDDSLQTLGRTIFEALSPQEK